MDKDLEDEYNTFEVVFECEGSDVARGRFSVSWENEAGSFGSQNVKLVVVCESKSVRIVPEAALKAEDREIKLG